MIKKDFFIILWSSSGDVYWGNNGGWSLSNWGSEIGRIWWGFYLWNWRVGGIGDDEMVSEIDEEEEGDEFEENLIVLVGGIKWVFFDFYVFR